MRFTYRFWLVQLQHQLFVTNAAFVDYCVFVFDSSGWYTLSVMRVEPDLQFWKSMLVGYERFYHVLLRDVIDGASE